MVVARRIWARLTGLTAAMLLSACLPSPPLAPTPTPVPVERPEVAPPVPSAESLSYARYYATVESRLVNDGMLRTDGGGADTPFTARQLAANFERIALYDEYVLRNGRFVAQQTPSRLRRWEVAVRIQPHFGLSVDAAQQSEDRSVLSLYATRLSRATGHPIRTVGSGGNFHVLYVSRDEQSNLAPLLRDLVPGIGQETINEIVNLPRFTFCSVYAFSQGGERPVYVNAVAIIRSEHPDLLRRSCVHEEVAQGLGLPNDSPAARPSIFNDDEEFALLTHHDELLLRMLYDNRLTPGLTPEQAGPLLSMLAEELLGGPS